MPTSSRVTELSRYHYDPLDRQAGCALLNQPSIRRFYCKSRLATEIQGAVQCSVFQHDDQLLAQLRREDVKVDTTLLATDQQRSVLNALDITRPHSLAYTPYGHRPLGNGLLSLLGFNGERPDPVTGHYHLGNGYRQFNPVLMRFNSPDSWSPFGKGGLNAYAYCAGNPINRKDPTGHYLVPAMIFDDIFMNTYKLMKNIDFRKMQFLDAMDETAKLLGGADNVKKIAAATKAHPDAITISALPKQKKITPLAHYTSEDNPITYLQNADSHLRELLKNRNISSELLNPKGSNLKYLNETETRNWTIDHITNTNELKRTTSYLLTLRIDGTNRAPDFNAKDWVEVASKIRDS